MQGFTEGKRSTVGGKRGKRLNVGSVTVSALYGEFTAT